MRKIQDEKKKKNFDIPKTILHNKRKIICLNLHPRTFQTDQSPVSFKELEPRKTVLLSKTAFLLDVCPLLQHLLSSSKLFHSFHPTPGSMPLSPFRYDGFRPARRKSRSSRVGDARLIYRSLATYAIACARFVTLERVAEDPSVTNHARNSQWNINELLQNIRWRVIIVYTYSIVDVLSI